jgi:hypothetical protein
MRTLILILLSILVCPLHAEDRGQIEDGAFWNSLSLREKVAFMEGYANGYISGEGDMKRAFDLTGGKSFNHTTADRDTPAEITFRTLITGVDKCYNDPRNNRLDIELCVDWTVRGIKGESDDVRETYLAAMRRGTETH